jgi:hypothetical protein
MTDPALLSEKGLSVNLPDKPPFKVKVNFLLYYFINLFLFQNCWKRKKSKNGVGRLHAARRNPVISGSSG